jgi:hypothetical protein
MLAKAKAIQEAKAHLTTMIANDFSKCSEQSCLNILKFNLLSKRSLAEKLLEHGKKEIFFNLLTSKQLDDRYVYELIVQHNLIDAVNAVMNKENHELFLKLLLSQEEVKCDLFELLLSKQEFYELKNLILLCVYYKKCLYLKTIVKNNPCLVFDFEESSVLQTFIKSPINSSYDDELWRYLIERGAEPGIKGGSFLIDAAEKGKESVVKYLVLEAHISPNIFKKLAIQKAREKKYFVIVNFLESYLEELTGIA